MSIVIGIACEDNGHFRAATRLVDGALVSHHHWLDGIIEQCRSWRGVRESEHWHDYHHDDANDIRPVTIDGVKIGKHGRIRGEPLKPEAAMWRKVLLVFCHSKPRPEAVILVRDMDGYPSRREGLVQVREGFEWPFKVIMAAAQPEIEAWHVAGFVPGDDDEQARLKELRAQLSFDPTTQSHRLTSHPNDATTDAKRALEQLCGAGQDRQDACLDDRNLLRERGSANGLTSFLEEVDRNIVPLFGAPQ